MSQYQPPLNLTPSMLDQVARVGRLSALHDAALTPATPCSLVQKYRRVEHQAGTDKAIQ
tara:strand:- start:7211 stop:7387 length:177 start_codon:yes stop_codon:yes gene_type:complete